MVKLAGEDMDLDYDVVGKDREEYVSILKAAVRKLLDRMNQKRWYQVYIGLCMVENGSYDLTDEQKLNANMLHDMTEETLGMRLGLQKEIASRVDSL